MMAAAKPHFTRNIRATSRLIAFGMLALTVGHGNGHAEEVALFDGFQSGWRARWREQRLFSKRTIYSVVQDERGKPVLHAVSNASNACLLREVEIISPIRARLSWRWKVRSSLSGNTAERERRGDDFAARVLVVFESSVLPLRTRAINYAWAAHEPVGAVFPNPFSSNVGMVVLRSGDSEAGRWQTETRDVLEDYRRFFGKVPGRISAVAVLVDTDNTDRTAEAWFADLMLDAEPSITSRE